MPHYLRGYCERAADGDAGTAIRFVASTEGIGRDGYIIDSGAWQIDAYRANPAVLWSHDYTGQRPPIGRASDIWVEDGKLMADIVFDQQDEFARQIEGKYRRGVLNAVSVGWDTQEVAPSDNPGVRGRITRAELLDISAVSIPGDPNALMERQRRALAGVGQALLDLVEPDVTEAATAPEVSARATWEETAAAMVALYTTGAQGPDDERLAAYRRLSRDYARLGRTAPEWLEGEHVAALAAGELRGVFLEGEAEMVPEHFEARAGKVLSRANLQDLQDAVDTIQRVIDRARSSDDAPADDNERAADDVLVRLHQMMTGVSQ